VFRGERRRHTDFTPRKPPTVAERVEAAKGETRSLDFKESFDPTQLSEWLELPKDLVAMANSGGGLIVVGVCNNGQPATGDVQPVLDLDPAKITDKIESYTRVSFDDFRISEVIRNGSRVAVIAVGPGLEAPIAFTRPVSPDRILQVGPPTGHSGLEDGPDHLATIDRGQADRPGSSSVRITSTDIVV
jgi:predicted HTH transcriptional regulator